MYEWAENNIKLDSSKRKLQKDGVTISESTVRREYIKQGGRIVLENSEILDNTTEVAHLEEAIDGKTLAEKDNVQHMEDSNGTPTQRRVVPKRK